MLPGADAVRRALPDVGASINVSRGTEVDVCGVYREHTCLITCYTVTMCRYRPRIALSKVGVDLIKGSADGITGAVVGCSADADYLFSHTLSDVILVESA